MDIKSSIEGILFVMGNSVSTETLAKAVGADTDEVEAAVQELAEEYDGKIVVGKCDVEENDELAAEFGIRNIPTILFFKNGEMVDKLIGAQPKAKLEEKFKQLL